MRRWIMSGAIVVLLMVLLLVALRFHAYYQYAEAHGDPLLPRSRVSDDTLRVAIVGDSWADYHHDYDTLLQSMMDSESLPVRLASKGNVGAKSKEVYERMMTTSRPLLANSPDYCVLMMGINDAVAKMGPDYYVHHYILALRLLLKSGIKPVVVEMPDVNYRAIAGRESLIKRLHHYLSAWLTGSERYGFSSYRDALWRAIVAEQLADSLVYVKAEAWNADGYRDVRGLYLQDEVHLNDKGYHLLDSCLATEILNDRGKHKLKERRYE